MDESLALLREAECLIKIIYTQRDRERKLKSTRRPAAPLGMKIKTPLDFSSLQRHHLLSDGQGTLMFLLFRLLICLHTIYDIYVVNIT